MAAGEDTSQYVFHHSVTSRRQENIIQFGQFEIIRCHQDHTSQQSIEAVMAKSSWAVFSSAATTGNMEAIGPTSTPVKSVRV